MADTEQVLLTAEELDTIGEIMNISMGSAATAVSTMLEKQVTITTPRLEQEKFKNIDSSALEPALIVKIRYVEGIEGTNVTMLRRHDMQIILDLLMGNEYAGDSEAFEFDEMSMSAACEVMNQMMGASATALSEILDMPINISTPEATLVENKSEAAQVFSDIQGEQQVVAISFKMMIKEVLDTTFSCFLPTELASKIVGYVSGSSEPEPPPDSAAQPQAAPPIAPQSFVPAEPPPAAAPAAQTGPAAANAPSQAAPQAPAEWSAVAAAPQAPPQSPPQSPPQYAPPPPAGRQPMQFNVQQPPQVPQGQTPPPVDPAASPQYASNPLYAMPAYPQQGQMPQGYPPQPYMPVPPQPYGYAPQAPGGYTPPSVPVKAAEFPDFSQQSLRAATPAGTNMGLLMGVQLEVSVVIGRTRRKIKDILEFGQGTVVELDKQTGAPAEIMVNGQLLAYGDVIVVGDNFGIRITEIVGTKELLDSLDPKM